MAVLNCEKFQELLPDLLLDEKNVPASIREDVRQHLAACSSCEGDWQEFGATMQLLDGWRAPEPSPYFSTRLNVRLREAKAVAVSPWLERVRAWWLFGSNLALRPTLAAAFALLLIVGGGSYAGFWSLNRTMPVPQRASATVKDLELLDSNAQTLQQLAAFEDMTTDQTARPAVLSN